MDRLVSELYQIWCVDLRPLTPLAGVW